MTYTGSGWYAASEQPPARTLEQGNAAALIFIEMLTPTENSKSGRTRFDARADVGRTRQVTAVLSSPSGTGCFLTPRAGQSSSHPNSKLDDHKSVRDRPG